MPSGFVQALLIYHFRKKMLLPFSFRYTNIHTFDEDLVSVRYSKHEYIIKKGGGVKKVTVFGYDCLRLGDSGRVYVGCSVVQVVCTKRSLCLVMIVSVLGILAEFMWVVVLYKWFVQKEYNSSTYTQMIF